MWEEVRENNTEELNTSHTCLVCGRCGKYKKLTTKRKLNIDTSKGEIDTFLISSDTYNHTYQGICDCVFNNDNNPEEFEDLITTFYETEESIVKIASACIQSNVIYSKLHPGKMHIYKKVYRDCDDEEYRIITEDPIFTIANINKIKEIANQLKNEDDRFNEYSVDYSIMERNYEKIIKLFSSINYWNIETTKEDIIFKFDLRSYLKDNVPRFETKPSIKKVTEEREKLINQLDVIGETLLKGLEKR